MLTENFGWFSDLQQIIKTKSSKHGYRVTHQKRVEKIKPMEDHQGKYKPLFYAYNFDKNQMLLVTRMQLIMSATL